MINRKNAIAFITALAAVSLAQAQAVAPTEITDTAGSLTAGFTTIKTLVVTVVTFGLVVGYLKLLRKK